MVDDVVVYLGLSGDVNDVRRAAVESFAGEEVEVEKEVGALRKTRAGGN